ncbi:hypothetical protein HYV57_05325 [Candidatus Peregrinibacteria bacterium]|nr:hypothetical protein [Candidatus Peregrinibacteria bacterium]
MTTADDKMASECEAGDEELAKLISLVDSNKRDRIAEIGLRYLDVHKKINVNEMSEFMNRVKRELSQIDQRIRDMDEDICQCLQDLADVMLGWIWMNTPPSKKHRSPLQSSFRRQKSVNEVILENDYVDVAKVGRIRLLDMIEEIRFLFFLIEDYREEIERSLFISMAEEFEDLNDVPSEIRLQLGKEGIEYLTKYYKDKKEFTAKPISPEVRTTMYKFRDNLIQNLVGSAEGLHPAILDRRRGVAEEKINRELVDVFKELNARKIRLKALFKIIPLDELSSAFFGNMRNVL